ncbi:MAG: GLUG motif-containing protein [Ignavibacteria bacterium]|nr:GLUG motif-containing protein [Ignavibacteria bacterium]
MRSSLFLFVFIFIFIGILQISAQTADLPSGSGTAEAPYQVNTLNNLYWVTQNSASWDKYFVQTANIDASTTSGWNGSAGFSPIGNITTPFTGSYNGQGSTISSLTISRSSTSYIGLFGVVDGGEVKNIGVTGVSITGSSFVSGIAGLVRFSAGLTSCYSSGTITGVDYVGGIAGSHEDGAVLDKSSSVASVNGNHYIGGIVGRNLATVTDCYSAGIVNGLVSNEGGLVGGTTSTPSVANSFWDTQVSTQASSSGGTGKTTAEMKSIATFTTTGTSGLTTPWDFIGLPNNDAGTNDYWNIDGLGTVNSGYPFLSSQILTVAPSGSGTSGAPYQIASLENLYWLSANTAAWASDKYIVQTADIHAKSTAYINFGKGFQQIGVSSEARFLGSYDGHDFTIDGLTINRPTESNIGLFGYPSGASISNLGLTDANVTGYISVGILVGYATASATISGCFGSGNVTGYSSTGGLVGDLWNYSTLTDCYSTGNVNGDASNSGGLVGKARGGQIHNSYSAANVFGDNSAGGLVGSIEVESQVSNSYSTGSVSGTDRVGGLAGRIVTTSNVSNCYSVGFVLGTTNVGGFLGYNEDGSTVTASFWDTQTSGTSNGIGNTDPDPGVTGKTTTEMKTQTTFTAANWDFVTIWQMIGVNYPDLRSNTNSALPVELVSFSANVVEDRVVLKWHTATEVNNYGFEVERTAGSQQYSVGSQQYSIGSQSQNTWEKISFVAGAGNSNSSKEYTFVDETASNGKYSYRLKQIDADGRFDYSNIIEIEIKNIPNKFELYQGYPNPFNPSTTIKFSLPVDSKVVLEVFNSIGEKVAVLVNQEMTAGYHTVNFSAQGGASSLSSGVYIYRLVTKNFSAEKKIILMK